MSLCFLAIDDEALALSDLVHALQTAEPDCRVCAQLSPETALEDIRAGRFAPDVAFLDIQGRGWDGLECAVQLKALLPKLDIIFVTAYPQYALKSYSLHARGYLLKPVTIEAVHEELKNLGLTRAETQPQKLLCVKCFGNFDVFCRGVPLTFPRAKCKELFAYLIYRNGAGCSLKEIAAVLYEDRAYDRSIKNQIETFKSDLVKTLSAADCGGVIVKKHNYIGVNPDLIDCDYYRFFAGDIAAINSFSGEFMTQYSWAEMATAGLSGLQKRD